MTIALLYVDCDSIFIEEKASKAEVYFPFDSSFVSSAYFQYAKPNAP